MYSFRWVKMRIPCVLTIAGSDSSGGAGVQADLKTFAALGVHGLCVLTSVTAQNTRGVLAIHPLPAGAVKKQLEAVLSDFAVRFAKTGMLATPENIRVIERAVTRHNLQLVVDPVMISTTGHRLIQQEAEEELLRLIERSTLVTPNVFEAQFLSGINIHTVKDLERAAREIKHRFGLGAVLVKGGHLSNRKLAVDVLLVGRKIYRFSSPRIAGRFHGAGCVYSAAITAELAKGAPMDRAVERAREFIIHALDSALEIGKGGLRTVNPLAQLFRRLAQLEAIEEIWTTANELVSHPAFVDLIPEVGTNIAVVLPGAHSLEDTVGLSGRIVRSGSKAVLTGFPQLGGSQHVARATLTAHHINPAIRAGINICFSESFVKKLKQMGLSVYSFNRNAEPPGVKTMEWGIRTALPKNVKPPVVVYDRGGKGKEAMIRIFESSVTQLKAVLLRLASAVYKQQK